MDPRTRRRTAWIAPVAVAAVVAGTAVVTTAGASARRPPRPAAAVGRRAARRRAGQHDHRAVRHGRRDGAARAARACPATRRAPRSTRPRCSPARTPPRSGSTGPTGSASPCSAAGGVRRRARRPRRVDLLLAHPAGHARGAAAGGPGRRPRRGAARPGAPAPAGRRPGARRDRPQHRRDGGEHQRRRRPARLHAGARAARHPLHGAPRRDRRSTARPRCRCGCRCSARRPQPAFETGFTDVSFATAGRLGLPLHRPRGRDRDRARGRSPGDRRRCRRAPDGGWSTYAPLDPAADAPLDAATAATAGPRTVGSGWTSVLSCRPAGGGRDRQQPAARPAATPLPNGDRLVKHRAGQRAARRRTAGSSSARSRPSSSPQPPAT